MIQVLNFRDISEVIKLIKTLNVKRASQTLGVPTKIVKLNADFFGNYIFKNFIYCLERGEYLNILMLYQYMRRK